MAVSLVFFLLVAEMATGKFRPQKTFSAAYNQAIKCFNKSDITIFALKPNCQMNLRVLDKDADVITRTNSLGYRGENFEIEKNEGEKRILVVGDSFILGWGVSDSEVLTQVLEEKLKDQYKIINAGYAGGMGPDGYYLHLKNYGMKLKPDLVIFSLFVYNDFTDLVDNDWIGTGAYGEPNSVVSNSLFVDENGILLPKNLPVIYKIPFFRNSHLAVLTYNSYTRIRDKTKWLKDRVKFSLFKPDIPEATARDSNLLGTYYSACIFGRVCHRRALHLFDDIMSVIKASRDIAENDFNDGKTHFMVMIIPADFQINPKLKEKYRLDTGIPYNAAEDANPNPQSRLKEMLEQEKIKYLDLLPILRKIDGNLYYPTDGHWNSTGHKAAGEALYNWIKTNYVSFS